MNEEVIVSGRMNPMVDPHLRIWEWPIPLYLFLGGMAAGILFFASLYYIRGKEKEYPAAVRLAPFLAPILLVIGLIALFYDLRHKLYFWQLYFNIKLQSPMSWGAWTLMVITPASFIWSALHIRDIIPSWDWKYKWLKWLEEFFNRYKKVLAWVILIYSLILGIYTGILLSAFNARPLWNTSILGPLFLASGLSAGAATIILFARNPEERKYFSRIDLVIIAVELFLIVHMFMGFLASTQVQIEAARLFLGGEYTAPFWIFVVILGLLFPALLEILELNRYHIPVLIPVILVLFGSFMLRFIIVYAGQVSRWLY
ncbi:MAG TPA: polysulfide reductase NrfD [Bacteroidales bacterium]|nr:polysulfide reductase NrfD [Bacteroidales bacterium]HRR92816.1 polysulfide reductase NrfD [Bacteroidales bacterium]HRT89934.1 polysulfide reductase NrfD [Bacteroidales bacterium]